MSYTFERLAKSINETKGLNEVQKTHLIHKVALVIEGELSEFHSKTLMNLMQADQKTTSVPFPKRATDILEGKDNDLN